MTRPAVIVRAEDGAGRITLNRPQALHSLTHDMCARITAALEVWRTDESIAAVLIDHSEGRGFCAGGDIRVLARTLKEDVAKARAFFLTEYRMDHLLFGYDKPLVSFMDGIVMGGGAGLALPCRFRVATERTRFAMPETGIGFFPDVGGGWYLPRLPGRIGRWLALTGARLDGAECLSLGLATHYLHSDTLAEAKARIAREPGAAAGILLEVSEKSPEAGVLAHREAIDRLFAADRLENVLAALAADPSEWAAKQLAEVGQKSPQAGKVALRQLAEGARAETFEDVMRMEYRIAARVIERPDFAEGIRAFILDKDDAPRWEPATPEAVGEDAIEAIFAPLPDDEEWTPLASA